MSGKVRKPQHDAAQIFRALRHRNFRIFFMGQLASMIGTWMQLVAATWLVYRLTDSAFLLGCTAFALNFPALIFSPFAGVLADRFDRRRLLVLVQILSMAQAALLAVLVFSGMIHLWHIMTLAAVLGVLNAFELTIRQSFITEMIDDRRDLGNAIALNSSVFNASRLIGPAAAGMIIALWGEGICFLINALSFIPIIVALMMMRIPFRPVKAGRMDAFLEIKEGIRYALGFMPIRSILLLLSALSMLSGVFQTLLPVFAKEVFHGGPQALGFLLSFSGVGALTGAFWLAARRTVVGLGRHVAVAGAAAGASLMCFAVLGRVEWAALAAMVSGISMILGIGGSNIILQSLVDEDKRGRVMSLYGLALMGMAPVGNILSGVLASCLGIVGTLWSLSLVTLAAALIFWMVLPRFRAKVRPVYAQKGFIPEA